MRFSIITSCGLLASVFAAPTTKSNRHVVHESRTRLPTHWSRNEQLPSDSYIPLRIALTQRNLDRADEFLMDVSHPDSSNYGKHWSAKKVAETFAPSEEAVQSVLGWLKNSGITGDRVKQSQSLNWIYANVTVSEAEDLLKTQYFLYTHAGTGQAHVACEDYSLPEDIQRHVDFVTPTVHFDAKVANPKKRRSIEQRDPETSTKGHNVEPGVGSSIGSPGDKSLPKDGGLVPVGKVTNEWFKELQNCDVSIVPDCLRALYEFPPGFPANSNNSFGIVEYSPQAYVATDLDLFFSNFSSGQVGRRPTLDSIDGGVVQTSMESFGYNGEADLDLEYGMALAYPQKVILYQVGDSLEGASFNNFLDALDESYCTYDGGDDPSQDSIYPDPLGSGPGVYSGAENCGGFAATKVISTSYAYNEADLTPFYEMRQCHEYMKLGLQGVTFLYSSGDYGVAGNGGQCIDPNTGLYNDGTSGMFNPSFPGTCPYITSVGATQIKPGASVTQPEEAAESVIYSGGGFSNVFSTPSYQESTLKTYFQNHLPSYGSDRYNTSQQSRGFPDVSANGVNYVVAIDGNFSYVYGTSASTPTFASVLTMVNAARLDVGKSPIGFVNPVLYAHPEVLNDITSGGNQGCGTPGFTAVGGWDPVTGLGTPNFPKMVSLWIKLP